MTEHNGASGTDLGMINQLEDLMIVSSKKTCTKLDYLFQHGNRYRSLQMKVFDGQKPSAQLIWIFNLINLSFHILFAIIIFDQTQTATPIAFREFS